MHQSVNKVINITCHCAIPNNSVIIILAIPLGNRVNLFRSVLHVVQMSYMLFYRLVQCCYDGDNCMYTVLYTVALGWVL